MYLACTYNTIILTITVLTFFFTWMVFITKMSDLLIVHKKLLTNVLTVLNAALLFTKMLIVLA